MKMKVWTNDLSIGNAQIDREHMRLIEIYNELVEIIKFKKERKDFSNILSKMTEYALIHFKGEEKYMKELSYPKFAEHKNHHKDYILKVSKYNMEISGANPPVPEDIIKFLDKWWINHILIIDRDYENYKKSIKSNLIYRSFDIFRSL